MECLRTLGLSMSFFSTYLHDTDMRVFFNMYTRSHSTNGRFMSTFHSFLSIFAPPLLLAAQTLTLTMPSGFMLAKEVMRKDQSTNLYLNLFLASQGILRFARSSPAPCTSPRVRWQGWSVLGRTAWSLLAREGATTVSATALTPA